MTEYNLKPCPFCGCDMKIETVTIDYIETACNEPNKQYQPPFCPHCGAKMDGGAEK